MLRPRKLLRAAIALLLCATTAPTAHALLPQKDARSGPTSGSSVRPAPVSKRVLLIGIDGCRADAWALASTPEMDELRAAGAFTASAQAVLPTLSGPNWSSMLTGTLPAKHGVVDNTFAGSNLASYPCFFARIKETTPWRTSASIVRWSAINEEIVTDADLELVGASDDEVVEMAVDLVRNGNPDVVFLHLNEVDATGHAFGFEPTVPQYLAAIEAADLRVGALRTALRHRARQPRGRYEEWLVMVGTDHGGILQGHGGPSPSERNVFWIVSGDSIQDGVTLPGGLSITDVPLTLFDFLGIQPAPAWDLDGVSILPAVTN